MNRNSHNKFCKMHKNKQENIHHHMKIKLLLTISKINIVIVIIALCMNILLALHFCNRKIIKYKKKKLICFI